MKNTSPALDILEREAIEHTTYLIVRDAYMLLVQTHGEERAGLLWMEIGYPAIVRAGFIPSRKV